MKDDATSKKNHSWIYLLIGILLIIVAIVAAILFFLKGSTTTTSTGGEVETTQSITCDSNQATYPFFATNSADRHSLKINVVLENDKLSTISLTYQLSYDDTSKIKQVTTDNRISLEDHFAKDGLSYASFDTHFSELDDSSQLTMYAKAKELNGPNAKYFLLEETNGSFKMGAITNAYNKKGLNCVVNK